MGTDRIRVGTVQPYYRRWAEDAAFHRVDELGGEDHDDGGSEWSEARRAVKYCVISKQLEPWARCDGRTPKVNTHASILLVLFRVYPLTSYLSLLYYDFSRLLL